VLNNVLWVLLALSLIFLGLTYLELRQKTKALVKKEKELDDFGSAQKAQLSKNLIDSNEKLKKANLRLQQLNVLEEDFVSVASHELRTPMTAIRSYAWMALHKSDMPLSEKLKKYLVRVLISTERMINLVNDFLNVSRIERSKIDVIPESVDLILLTKDIIDEVYYSKSADKKIQFSILEKPIPKVFADPEKLREVMLNLVGNAVKFTPPGGSVTVEYFSDGQTVETTIKDTGIGFTKDDCGRLFQKFGKLDHSYVSISSSAGTGLGLYISRNLIELMHGKIRASSLGLGKGSSFTFSLPVASKEVISKAQNYTVKPKEGMEAKPLEQVAI